MNNKAGVHESGAAGYVGDLLGYVVSSTCGCSVWNLLHVSFLVSIILRGFHFWKIFILII